MTQLFDDTRRYVLGDPELELIGDNAKLAQWRHKGIGPAYYKLGRKIIYCGLDLNAWAEANRVEPTLDPIAKDNPSVSVPKPRLTTNSVQSMNARGGAKTEALGDATRLKGRHDEG